MSEQSKRPQRSSTLGDPWVTRCPPPQGPLGCIPPYTHRGTPHLKPFWWASSVPGILRPLPPRPGRTHRSGSRNTRCKGGGGRKYSSNKHRHSKQTQRQPHHLLHGGSDTATRMQHLITRCKCLAALLSLQHKQTFSSVWVSIECVRVCMFATRVFHSVFAPCPLTLPRTSFSCATSVARSARSLSRCSTVLRSTLISCIEEDDTV